MGTIGAGVPSKIWEVEGSVDGMGGSSRAAIRSDSADWVVTAAAAAAGARREEREARDALWLRRPPELLRERREEDSSDSGSLWPELRVSGRGERGEDGLGLLRDRLVLFLAVSCDICVGGVGYQRETIRRRS